MKKPYYKVYIKDENTTLDFPIICEAITKINTQKYGFAYVFRDIITRKIIRPYYDTTIDKIYNTAFGTLTYDNINKIYHKISTKNVLQYLKKISNEYIEEQQKILNHIEERHISKIKII